MEKEEQLAVDPNTPRPWYFQTATIVLGFLCLYPFILPLIWCNPYYSSSRKVMLTFLILVASAGLLKAAIIGLN